MYVSGNATILIWVYLIFNNPVQCPYVTVPITHYFENLFQQTEVD